jgi:hypothetical protein
MNSLVLKYNDFINYFYDIKSERLGFYFSFFFHLIFVIFAIGLPNIFSSKPIVLNTIIPIEIINISNMTSIPNEPKKTDQSSAKKVSVKEKKFNSSDNQEIKKIKIKDKPKIQDKIEIKEKMIINESVSIKRKKEIIPELKKEKIIVEEKSEKLLSKKIVPKLKPKEDISNIKETKKTDIIKTKPKTEPDFNIQLSTMMKDIRNEKSSKKIESEIEEEKEEIINKSETDTLPEIAQLSISEIDLVLQQLSQCFIAPLGAVIEKSTYVKIKAKINQKRRVIENTIRIVDTNIDKNNPFYGPITRSSMNTFLNPDCTPLKLPEDKYDLWKEITLTFDYSIMKGN